MDNIEEKTLGKYFKILREKRGLSLHDVAERLHVHLRIVRLFEEENLQDFSAHVYARGFFEKYAKLLELNVADLLPYFEELWQLQKGSPEASLKPSVQNSPLKIFITPRRAVVALAMLFAGVLGLYLLRFAISPLYSPDIQWDEPIDKLITYEPEIIIRGISDPRLELTLNKQPVYIKEDKTFEKKLFLYPGINVLHLEAKNGLGKAVSLKRRVVFE